MPFDFKPLEPVTDFRLKTATFIAGGSGTGKTYSALLLARGLAGDGGKIAFLDTENGRALHYRADFPEVTFFDFGAEIDGEMVGFPPERWIEAIRQLQKTFDVIVTDSWSHSWEGINGITEQQGFKLDELVAEAEQKAQGRYAVDSSKFQMQSWVEPKRRYRRLIETVIRADAHIILCARAKPVIQKWDKNARKNVNAFETKLRRPDLPWDIAADRDLIFEMSSSMILTPERPGEPIMLKCPDAFREIFPAGRRVSREAGATMRKWADDGGVDRKSKQLMDDADSAAMEGTAAFRAFWEKLDKGQRDIVRSKITQFQTIAERADQQANSDDPFVGSDRDTGATPEEMAEAERQARERPTQMTDEDYLAFERERAAKAT